MAEGGDKFPHTHLRDGFKAFCVIHTLHASKLEVCHILRIHESYVHFSFLMIMPLNATRAIISVAIRVCHTQS